MEEPPISKRKLKKLKRDQEWEANREQRKARRKEKFKEKKERRRAAQGDGKASAAGSLIPNPPINATTPPSTNSCNPPKEKQKTTHPIQLPITIILDCGFDELMTEKEIKSLGAQITRCYSDNHKAPFKAHLAISSFGGQLKERFDNILSGHYSSWKGVKFLENDFYEAAQQAKEWMKRPHGGKLLGALAPHQENPDRPQSSNLQDQDQDQDQKAEAEAEAEAGELVYLTSDSPNTLTKLKPYSTYIIGGLVDRNRHKGICYKRAMDRGVKTAKLPIGDYMQMNSRFVLATNHVSEIMLRWMELGDWGEAFLRVIPKRKGGILKGLQGGPGLEGEEEEETGMEILNDNEHDDDNGNGEIKYEDKEHENESLNLDQLEQTKFEAPIKIGGDSKHTLKTHERITSGMELEVEPPKEDSFAKIQADEKP